MATHLGLDARGPEWKGERVVPMLPLGGAPTAAHDAKHARGTPSGMPAYVNDLTILVADSLRLLAKAPIRMASSLGSSWQLP